MICSQIPLFECHNSLSQVSHSLVEGIAEKSADTFLIQHSQFCKTVLVLDLFYVPRYAIINFFVFAITIEEMQKSHLL
jgi:hypothetical protein